MPQQINEKPPQKSGNRGATPTTDNVLKLFSSLGHPRQVAWFSSDISSSHPYFWSHKLWSRLFAWRITGATNLRGSYIELTTDNVPLRVGAFSWCKIRKLKLSVSMSLWTPNFLNVSQLFLRWQLEFWTILSHQLPPCRLSFYIFLSTITIMVKFNLRCALF